MMLTNNDKLEIIADKLLALSVKKDTIQYVIDNPDSIDFPDGDGWTEEIPLGLSRLIDEIDLQIAAIQAEKEKLI